MSRIVLVKLRLFLVILKRKSRMVRYVLVLALLPESWSQNIPRTKIEQKFNHAALVLLPQHI